MHIQRVNNSQPNFQAVKLQTVTRTIGQNVKKIDVYSINNNDTVFIDRMLESVKGQKFPEDKYLIGSDSVRGVFDSAFKRAKNITDTMKDRVMIAIENDRNIVGLMDIKAHGDQLMHGLAVWNGDNLARKSLIRAGVKNTERMDEFTFVIPTKFLTQESADYFRSLQFKKPRQEFDLMIDYENLGKVNIIKDKTAQIKDYKNKRNVNLSEILKLDE